MSSSGSSFWWEHRPFPTQSFNFLAYIMGRMKTPHFMRVCKTSAEWLGFLCPSVTPAALESEAGGLTGLDLPRQHSKTLSPKQKTWEVAQWKSASLVRARP